MEILRVFNNNVVLARADHGGEVIVTGRGLGFQAKPGHPVDTTRVARVFVPEDGRDPDNFGALVAAVPPEHLVLADRALDVARAELGTTLGSTTVIALADHLSFAVVRSEKNMPMSYPLRGEVVHMYPREYAVATKVLEYVNTQLDRPLVVDEAIAIALHLVNAGFASGDLSFTYQMTGVFTQLFDIMGVEYDRVFDRDSVNAARFITHLRYFFVRASTGRQLEERSGKLRDAIQGVYPDAHATAVKLQTVLELRLGVPLTDDEVTYLTLHVARMVDEVRPGDVRSGR
ncbi:phosphocarrier protein HPr [Rhodococcus sp. Leaf7]|uniref:PRD domain-containing protein n=1 Tax=unclassified Rhodococcus (in: high G+C Gram-positive bacteria) TaxID=192944 RepID=UPI0006FC4D7A|nr:MULTISPECIES: PRD domain-containing protein [unclassified Rhodococcus (in: high G+C Gram-positive bacteria)]KQU07143.1 phosphocarrier protein HPr [Rhodococcus sp. Leaf7]KQU42661.1 phosphocarrier protein HPr [Rhodococcus sp. Leaf247]